MFNFEKMEVWRKSIALTGYVYKISRSVPTDEGLGLDPQIRRVGVSVAEEIPGGPAKPPADFQKIPSGATGSLFEVITRATIAKYQTIFSDVDFQRPQNVVSRISFMLSGWRKSLDK